MDPIEYGSKDRFRAKLNLSQSGCHVYKLGDTLRTARVLMITLYVLASAAVEIFDLAEQEKLHSDIVHVQAHRSLSFRR